MLTQLGFTRSPYSITCVKSRVFLALVQLHPALSTLGTDVMEEMRRCMTVLRMRLRTCWRYVRVREHFVPRARATLGSW
jgi:hypothetical protein